MNESMQMRRVGLVAKRTSRDAIQTGAELADWLGRRDVKVAVDESIAKIDGESSGDLEQYSGEEEYDLIIVLGGDGTLLSVARSASEGVPILGVNLGTLGFLTEVSRAELYPTLVEIMEGDFDVEKRALLNVELSRATGNDYAYQCFNDAVVAKSALSRIIQLRLEVDGRLVATVRADGLITSTPSGSTAYNLSAGGPIVSPVLPVFLLTPICPHTLSFRPIVVPDSSVIEVTLETRQEEVYLTLDGQEGTTLGYRDTVRVTLSDKKVPLIRARGRTFYSGLRDKLHWGE